MLCYLNLKIRVRRKFKRKVKLKYRLKLVRSGNNERHRPSDWDYGGDF